MKKKFRVRRPRRRVVSISIRPEDLALIDQRCQAEQRSRSEWILAALRDRLQRVGPRECSKGGTHDSESRGYLCT